MSNRMSVLSRRLERFAVGFSLATLVFFMIGLYVAANNPGQLVFALASLDSVCLFAAFFLWLAHGFAWAMIPETPVVAKKPAESSAPAESMKPAEVQKPVEARRPAEASKPVQVMKLAEVVKPLEVLEPIEEFKPIEAMKPAEETEIAPEEDPPDAKYTITGKRIY
jgi:hypothetical protein